MVERVEKTLDAKGLLFVGDCKLGSIGNRSIIAQKEHYYLTPLSRLQMSFRDLEGLVNSANEFICMDENAETKAFEHVIDRQHGQHMWQERLIVAYSPTYAHAQIAQFDQQTTQSEQSIQALTVIKKGKTPIKNEGELRQKIKDILHRSKTTDFFDVQIQTTTTETIVGKYANKPQENRLKFTFEVTVIPNLDAMKAHKDILGWRVYATNAPKEALNRQKAMQTYKDEYKVEYRFNQLQNKTAVLMPIYLQKDERIKALVRILMMAIKILSIIQDKAREALKKTQSQVKELFPGNPGRKTSQPTAEMILRAFLNISLVTVVVNDNKKHIEVSKLSKSQIYLLELLGIKPSIYEELPQFLKSNSKISET